MNYPNNGIALLFLIFLHNTFFDVVNTKSVKILVFSVHVSLLLLKLKATFFPYRANKITENQKHFRI